MRYLKRFIANVSRLRLMKREAFYLKRRCESVAKNRTTDRINFKYRPIINVL